MMAFWTAIQSSFSKNQRYILNLDISQRQGMIKLRDKPQPGDLSWTIALVDRFSKLGNKKRKESMKEWLSK